MSTARRKDRRPMTKAKPWAPVTVAALAALFGLLSTVHPARAQASTSPSVGAYLTVNNNPIDWSIIIDNLTTRDGVKLPFRKGQADTADGQPGFGYRHAQQAHAFPQLTLIQQALHTGVCKSPSLGRWTCTSSEVEVGYNLNVDPRSRDNFPVGIMTAYYKAPCAC